MLFFLSVFLVFEHGLQTVRAGLTCPKHRRHKQQPTHKDEEIYMRKAINKFLFCEQHSSGCNLASLCFLHVSLSSFFKVISQ